MNPADRSLMRHSVGANPVLLQTVEKAMQILEAVVDTGRPVGVTELANRFEINPSTVYRILATLKAYDLVHQDEETSRYKAGTGLLRLSGPLWAALDVRVVARPVMEQLALDTGESVNLMVPDGDRGMYIDAIEGKQNIRMVVSMGSREYYHCSAVGKAILAHIPPEKAKTILEASELKRMTAKTITDRGLLLEHLRLVRERGCAFDDEEGEEGTRCVGAAIQDASGATVAGLSVSGPVFRLSFSKLEAYAPLVQNAADQISRLMGYSFEPDGEAR